MSEAKIQEAERAIETATARAAEAQAAHDAAPTDETASALERAQRRLDLAKATLAKRLAAVEAAAEVARVDAEHQDARKAERAIAGHGGGGLSPTPAFLEAVEHTKQLRAKLVAAQAAHEEVAARPIGAGEREVSELRAECAAIEAELRALDTAHAEAERAYSAAPSDERWSRVIELRRKRERETAALHAARAILHDAEADDRARARLVREADERAQAEAARERSERAMLAFSGQLRGAGITAALAELMHAQRAQHDALAALRDALGAHNVAHTKAEELSASAGRPVDSIGPIAFEQLLAGYKWWLMRERSARADNVGSLELTVYLMSEAIPRGALEAIFTEAIGTPVPPPRKPAKIETVRR